MTDETTFRILLSIIFLIFIIIWGYSFIASGLNRYAFYTPDEGILGALLLRLLLTVSIFCILVYLYNPYYLKWSSLYLPPWARLTGFITGLLSLFLIGWTLKSLGHYFSATLFIKKNHILITSGLYKSIRHPMYSGFVVLWVSFLLLSSNWFIGLTGILAYMAIFVTRVPREEQMMINKFGEEYIKYMKRTGRYFPRIKIKKRKI